MPREYQFPFELRHLVYVREVARRLHFRKAAEALGVAQPALSRQVAQLEAALGVRLFNRSSRRVELTPAGAAFAERIEPVLSALLRIPADMKAVSEGQVGRLRVAFTGLAMATVLPDILRGFHRRFPGIRVELNESPTSSQLAALQAGEIDCGFFHPDAPSPGISTILLLRERNGVLLPADHPLRSRRSLTLKELGDTPFVLFPGRTIPDSTIGCWPPSRSQASLPGSPRRFGPAQTASDSCERAWGPHSYAFRGQEPAGKSHIPETAGTRPGE